MKVDFEALQEVTVPHLYQGNGEVSAKMAVTPTGKYMYATIASGNSIGMHTHETSMDVNYIISGTGYAVCDGEKEMLHANACHVCPVGSSHSIVNDGEEPLVLFTMAVENLTK